MDPGFFYPFSHSVFFVWRINLCTFKVVIGMCLLSFCCFLAAFVVPDVS